MNLQFNDEEKMILGMVRAFMDEEVRPIAKALDDEKRVPIEQIRALQEQGLFGLLIPEEYGGANISASCYAAVIEEMSKVCAALAIVLSVHNSVGAYPILLFGSEEQKKTYLGRLAGDWIGAFCLTETQSGSDAAGLRTKAVLDGDAYLLDGTKMFVTNGTIADLFLVLARTSESPEAPHRGVTAFLVEKGTPGFRVSKTEDKMGLRASDTAEVVFEECRVPVGARLGREGEGFKVAMSALDNGRIGVASQALGIAEGAFDEAVKYARTRKQFSKAIAEFQAIQFMIADMDTQIEAARALIRHAAHLKDSGRPYGKEASMAKLYASTMSRDVCSKALQIHGGYGYVKEYPVERYYRDQRITEIYEGTSEMQRHVIAKYLLSGRA
ncbi:MAG: acyl-CoA dehydrogenase family protein [Candidatus Eisenbacteria bacterium]|nr:acyl-CoA dehydrogenase family protein [Candidatus Eisenbacteria bacterium]